MKIFIIIVILITIAVFGHRRSFLKLPFPAKHIYLTGTEYIVVGFLLGKHGLNILNDGVLIQLHPLLALTLGWVGLLFGLQMDTQILRKFPRYYINLTFAQTVTTFLLMIAPMFFILQNHFHSSFAPLLIAASALAASASCTGQSSLALIQKEFQLQRSRTMGLLRFVSGIDGVFAIFICCFISSLSSEARLFDIPVPSWMQWFIISIFIGILLGLLLDILVRQNVTQSELMVFCVGFVVFAGGLAFYSRTSILFVTMLMGIVVSNRHDAEALASLMNVLEKPAFIILLIFAGALIPLAGLNLIEIIVGYAIFRIFSKFIGGWIGKKISSAPRRIPSHIGLGLLSQGGVSIAIAMSYYWHKPGPLADAVLITIVIAQIISELMSPHFVTAIIDASGER